MPDTSIYDRDVASASNAHGVPVDWIKATIGAETSFKVDPADVWEPKVREFAYGPMNILLSTARGLGFAGSGAELRQASTNIYWGAAYLADLRDRFGTLDFRAIYSAYNSGSPDKWTTSTQVGKNVARALTWLQQFTPTEEEAGVSGLAIAGLALAGLWWLSQHRGEISL